jgi:DNA-binding transcriptional LysR family regulator
MSAPVAPLPNATRHLDDLLLFLQIADAGGFSAAERRTGIPKSRLSRRLATLEAALGVRLLHRSAQSFGLTGLGEEIARHAREAAAQVERITQLSQDSLVEPNGVVHLHTSVLIGETTLPPLLAEFSRRYPRVRVQLTLSNRFVDLIEERLDLVIRAAATPLASADVIARPLASTASVIVAHPALLEAGLPDSLDALANRPCLAQGTLLAPRPWQFIDAHGATLDWPVSPVIAVDNLLALRELALGGAGFAQLPIHLCEAALADGRLVRVLDTLCPRPATLYVMYQSRHGMSSAVRALLDFLQQAWPNGQH